MAKKSISIESVEIKIGSSVRKLTIAQAKELRDVLNEVFPDGKTVRHEHYDYWGPWRGPYWTTTWCSSSPTKTTVSDYPSTTTSNVLYLSANEAA